MSLRRFHHSQKSCATCNFWMGMRKLDSVWSPAQVIIESQRLEDEVGVCSNRKSNLFNARLRPERSCHYWNLWERFKTYK